MKTIIENLTILGVCLVVIGGLMYSGYVTNQQDTLARQECDKNGKVMHYSTCYTKYDLCLLKLKNSFGDLTDTWGVSTNNQDSISKTIQSEMDRCIANQ